MKIQGLEFVELNLPFRTTFKHSLKERSTTETVLAVVKAENGVIGYGEGCPRVYVTAETIKSCHAFLEDNLVSILEINSLASLLSWIDSNTELIDLNPAAWCAIETGILDSLGKIENKSIEELLSLAPLQGEFQYSAVLGTTSLEVFKEQFEKYFKLGFRDYKLKIFGEEKIDLANISLLSSQLSGGQLRLDANKLWQNEKAAVEYLKKFKESFFAVEEPIQDASFEAFDFISNELACLIILDESFLRLGDVKYLANQKFMPNIRISKMGGLIRSLRIAEACFKLGRKFIIGAQVGETSILTRVALSLANAYRSSVFAQEGAFGEYLLTKDIVEKPLMFGAEGSLRPDNFNRAGLGLEIINIKS